MSTVGTPSLVAAVRDRLFSASSFSCWQSSQIGPVWLSTCSSASASGVQRHPRGLDSYLPQGESSSLTGTQHTKSLSTRGASVRFPSTLCRVTHSSWHNLQWGCPPAASLVLEPAKPLSTSAISLPYQLNPKQLNFFFPACNIINANKWCAWEEMGWSRTVYIFVQCLFNLLKFSLL